MIMRDAADGSELTRLDLRDFEPTYGFPYTVIRRIDLHAIFVRACQRRGVELITTTMPLSSTSVPVGTSCSTRFGAARCSTRSPCSSHRVPSPARPNGAPPDELDHAFAGSCDAIQQGLVHLWRDRRWRMFDREPNMNWVFGRVVLLGDSAHPPLDLGGNVACLSTGTDRWVATGRRGPTTQRRSKWPKWSAPLPRDGEHGQLPGP